MRQQVDVDLRNRTTAMITEGNLVHVRDNFSTKRDLIVCEHDTLMADLSRKARACKTAPREERMVNLRKLLPHMSAIKQSRQKTALADKQLKVLDMQINAFENLSFQKEMTDTLRASVAAMKKIGITDEDEVNTMVLDIEDTMSQQNQVSDALSMTLVNSMDDTNTSDDALMRELMALMGDDEDTFETTPVPVHKQIKKETVSIVHNSLAPTPSMVVLPPVGRSVTQQMLAVDHFKDQSQGDVEAKSIPA